MREYDDAVLECFLDKQLQLFPEAVAETLDEAEDFLEECMAVVVDSVEDVIAMTSSTESTTTAMHSSRKSSASSSVSATASGKSWSCLSRKHSSTASSYSRMLLPPNSYKNVLFIFIIIWI